MSLGGVRDESEIRGHRRTYIGSMPGKIIQSMKKVKTSNPLILLDEIDKLGMDYRGDPASALLEVLDPEQNSTFNDHYLEVDYDLSNVMFVTTANTLNIPGPLLDRMEDIRIPGYTEDEKVEIAKRHLLPKSIANHGLKKGEFELSDDALRQIIRTYTREAGVRNLERDLANVCRKTVTKIVRENIPDVSVIPDNLEDFLGVSRYRFGLAEKEDQVGVVTGLAWTEVGGELLTIEGVMLPGKGKMTTTGKLGDVMKESEKWRWIGPMRYDLVGAGVWMLNKSYRARVEYLPAPRESSSRQVICTKSCPVCLQPAHGRLNPAQKSFKLHAQNSLKRCESDWRAVEGEFAGIMLVIMPCRSEKSQTGVCKYSHLSDGRVHLVMIKACSRWRYLRFLLRLSNQGLETGSTDDGVIQVEACAAIKITHLEPTGQANGGVTGKESVWNVDGELLRVDAADPVLYGEVHRSFVRAFSRGVEE